MNSKIYFWSKQLITPSYIIKMADKEYLLSRLSLVYIVNNIYIHTKSFEHYYYTRLSVQWCVLVTDPINSLVVCQRKMVCLIKPTL